MSGSIREAMSALLREIEHAHSGMPLSDLLQAMNREGFEPAMTQAAFRMAVEREQIRLDKGMRAHSVKEMMAA